MYYREIIKDPELISEAFNNYFTEIGPQLASTIKKRINPMSYLSSNIENSMFLPHIDENEISTIIKNIKNSSTCWDNLPPVLFKSCISSSIKPLTYIVNKSFESGIFPDPLKLAKIVPIFKSGYKNRRAKLGQIQGGLQRASQDSTKGGGVAIIFYFLRV